MKHFSKLKYIFVCFALCSISAYANLQKNVGTVTFDEENQPVKILKKPEAAYPRSETGTVCLQGTVTLKVQFLASGEVGEIRVISGLPYGVSENASEAAKKIEFKPAVRNGKTATMTKIITYNFTIY